MFAGSYRFHSALIIHAHIGNAFLPFIPAAVWPQERCVRTTVQIQVRSEGGWELDFPFRISMRGPTEPCRAPKRAWQGVVGLGREPDRSLPSPAKGIAGHGWAGPGARLEPCRASQRAWQGMVSLGRVPDRALPNLLKGMAGHGWAGGGGGLVKHGAVWVVGDGSSGHRAHSACSLQCR